MSEIDLVYCQPVLYFAVVLGHSKNTTIATEVVKLVDMHVSGACALRCAGSSPAFGTD